LISYSGIMG